MTYTPTPEDYVNAGWYIFPCHSIDDRGRCTCRDGGKCQSPGKHPHTHNGVKDATNDIQTVRMWQSSYPGCNWGVAAGRQSGIVIIDIDPKHDGFASFDRLETERPSGALPRSLRATSGGGGRHIFYRYPTDGISVGNRVNWLPGVDIRSDGGYVILPPGSHISGGRYRWDNWGTDMAPIPNDVADSVRSSSRSTDRDLLADSASILDGVPEGSRDDTLFRWACRLRRQHASDADGGRSVVTALVLAAAANCTPPFPEDQAMRKVEQAYAQDHTDDEPDWGSGDDDDGVSRLTDMGNRDRLIKLHGDNIRYVPEMGWYVWTDIGWRPIHENEVVKMAEDISSAVREESKSVADGKNRVKFMRWADVCESSGALTAAVRLAKGDSRILQRADDFDAAMTDLACYNGIVDLRTGRLRPFQREDLITRNTEVTYDPDADMGWWLEFINAATGGDEELATYLQMAAGYTATGLNTQECFFIINGPPASGKSTYIDALMAALGTYATTSQSDTFMYRRGKDAAPNELARLQGMRLVSVSEIREGDHFNEALIKQVTGGDAIQARHLYKEGFIYTPQFKLWIGTNHDPISNDGAMLRRIKMIKFPRTVPAEERDPKLKLKVRDHDAGSPAVLRWIVEGAYKFLQSGMLEEPSSVTTAAHEYKFETDVLAMFLNSAAVLGADNYARFTDLFSRWVMWCREMNEHPGRAFTFKKRLADRGFTRIIGDDGTEYYRGLELLGASLASYGGGTSWS